jgi:Family of unknown function (DUF5681)
MTLNRKQSESSIQPQNGKPVRGDEATRWKPGQSGNPGGRPKRTPLIDACREVLSQLVPGDAKGRTYAQAIAEKLAAKAVEGDIRAAQELADRAEGKARQTLQIVRRLQHRKDQLQWKPQWKEKGPSRAMNHEQDACPSLQPGVAH